jgi:2-haloalkanoic acid dehalogenase type II
MRFRYLTFDCYGTLIDWRKGMAKALGAKAEESAAVLRAYAVEEKKQEVKYQSYREVLRRSALALPKTLGLQIGPDLAASFASSVPSWPAFPDSRGFLRRMGELGYSRYILSNVDTETLEETIRRTRLEVDGYVTAEQVRSYKPARRHWVRFLQKTGARRDEVLHVAQSVFHDVLPAQDLGIASAWVNRYRDPVPAGAQPLFMSDNLAHLGALLEVQA